MSPADQPDRDQRPSPDALLAAAAGENRGKLKLFLGAAPGVGKTYEMLSSALQRKSEGWDVVVGVAETHGRIETERLLRDFEITPRRRIDYKGRPLEEMDLDALLARRPRLALVDELAHTNAEGSRHPKRFQDVEELLEHGIDVYTTLNIQHVESLNDIVAKITRIRVRETVPDAIIDRADEIEMVDITPEELIERLNEGKVYVRDQAQRALKHYFLPGNLTALRELALRRTAERVDEQMLSYMRAHAIAGPWAAGDRILVALGEGANAARLVRYGRHIAERLKASWVALHIETPAERRLSEGARDRIADALRLAEQLGGQAVTIPGERIADDILSYARDNNITQILLGKSDRRSILGRQRGSPLSELLRKAGPIGLHIVAGEGEALPAKTVRTALAGEPRERPRLLPYVGAAIMVALATAIGMGIYQFVQLPNISLLFLAAILYSAVRHGLWPSLFASLLSVFAYNFFFIPPVYSLTIADPANVLALAVFTIVAMLTSNLTARTRRQAVIARRQVKTTAELNAFSRKLAGIGGLDDLLWAASFQIASMLKTRVIFLFPENGRMAVAAGYPPEDVADEADLAAARWSWDHKAAAGRGSDTLPGAKRLFLPMVTQSGVVAVVGLDREAPGALFAPAERRLLDALLDQIAVSIERIRLVDDLDEVRVQAATERMRSALLTSISHDLRTPLAAILGSITSLRRQGGHHDAPAREELMATIEEEAERLNRFVANLLDMTRLESGGLRVNAERVDLADILGAVLRRAGSVLARHRVALDIPPGLPMLAVDPVLFDQVLFNILDNAAKHAPAGSLIRIAAEAGRDEIRIRVIDEGPGIPPADLEAIFDKFHRVKAGDQRIAGTGLGLAVCRGFMQAFGGTITASNRADRPGAVFTLLLPATAEDAPAAAPALEARA